MLNFTWGCKMKIKNILFIFLVIGIVFLAGCSGSASNDDQQYYGSGGCGVGAPDIDYNDNTDAVEKADDLNSLEM